jgi:hypothetical protein
MFFIQDLKLIPKIVLIFKVKLSNFFRLKNMISGSVAQWITRLTTNQEIAGSIPARLDFC